jgi:hypothetical protein
MARSQKARKSCPAMEILESRQALSSWQGTIAAGFAPERAEARPCPIAELRRPRYHNMVVGSHRQAARSFYNLMILQNNLINQVTQMAIALGGLDQSLAESLAGSAQSVLQASQSFVSRTGDYLSSHPKFAGKIESLTQGISGALINLLNTVNTSQVEQDTLTAIEGTAEAIAGLF